MSLTREQIAEVRAAAAPGANLQRLCDAALAAMDERDALAMRAREVTCVWCGFQFQSTLKSQAEHLYEHAKVCEKHPVYALRAENERLHHIASVVLLPMAAGYAAEHNVGRNQEMVEDAQRILGTRWCRDAALGAKL